MGQRRNAGLLETPALVTSGVWQTANAALANRIRSGRGTTVQPKALLSPVCGNCYGQEREGCPSRVSPMYRTVKDGLAYYRCFGQGAQRKGCGHMLPVVALDAYVRGLLAKMTRKHVERVFIPGDDNSDRITKAQELGAAALRAGDYRAAAEAMQEAERIDAEPCRKARWESRTR